MPTSFLNICLLILILFGGLAKAQFLRVVILAGLGLAGLWMVHTIAQDFSKIRNGSGTSSGVTGNDEINGKFLEKRSIDFTKFNNNNNINTIPEINWEMVLSRDPASCARSFVCQLSSQEETHLTSIEKSILQLTKFPYYNSSWAGKELLEAIDYGRKSRDPKECMKFYKFCPFSSRTMTSLLSLFGS